MTGEELINIGDVVFCVKNGVRGKILKFYTPTACEEQIMVETDDGRGQYHAPKSWWKLYQPEEKPYLHGKKASMTVIDEYVCGIDLASGPDMTGNMLNKHGEYVIEFANNHGISIAEAHEAPMVKAHLVAFNAMEDMRKNGRSFLRSATD